MRKKILVTRPIEDCFELAEEINQRGYDVICEPFLEVIVHDKPIPNLKKYEGLIFTSGNAVRAFCQNSQNRELRVWAVGDATKVLAIKSGFKNVQSAQGKVSDLLSILPKNLKILYVRAQHISAEIKGGNIEEIILYRTEKKEKISNNILELMAQSAFSHILFFSKRTAESFVDMVQVNQLEEGLKTTKALCLGSSMVNFVSVLPWMAVEVAVQPNRHSILELLD